MRGFVTLAVGNEKYYRLAENLLASYRAVTKNPMPFAIIADRENEYTAQFDKVVILENPSCSYMDKIEMLNCAPFQENIFIDADCLAYGDINNYWDYFGDKGGVRCIGKALSLQSRDGWFTIENIGEYSERVQFIPQMHGGIMYFRADQLTKQIYELAKIISANYSKYSFRYFTKPADEPILALSTAVNNCRPIELSDEERDGAYLFLPIAKRVKVNIAKGICRYSYSKNRWIEDVLLVHWQNRNTEKPLYLREIDRLKYKGNLRIMLRYAGYVFAFWRRYLCNRANSAVKRVLKI